MFLALDLSTGWAQLRLRDQEKCSKRQGQGCSDEISSVHLELGVTQEWGSFHKLTLLACALTSVETLQFVLQEVGREEGEAHYTVRFRIWMQIKAWGLIQLLEGVG